MFPTPLPPDTMKSASAISTISFLAFIVSKTLVLTSLSANLTSTFSILHLDGSVVIFANTPGLTVAICGLCSGQAIVAIRLPPNAGLVAKRSPFVTSTSIDVQSAVNPVDNLAAILGPKSLPMKVAPTNNIPGFLSFAKSQITFV
ncbi:hypothetical protein CBEIJ_52230 [Clostridium beijerinckii]|nr:hypothetical protein CBEIJ_52230 [Clostridium beijerinckii]